MNIKDYVTTIPNFPKEGIMFRDITSVLEDADGFQLTIDTMTTLIKDLDFDIIMAAEARGFVFGSPIAYNLRKPLTLARKKGKLPRETISAIYELEYGTDSIEVHKDSIKEGSKVLLLDDLLATGGTLSAMAELVHKSNAEVAGVLVMAELLDLKGREKLSYPVYSAIQY